MRSLNVLSDFLCSTSFLKPTFIDAHNCSSLTTVQMEASGRAVPSRPRDQHTSDTAVTQRRGPAGPLIGAVHAGRGQRRVPGLTG